MALRAGRVGVKPDQVNAQGEIIAGGSPSPTPTPSIHEYSTIPKVVGKWIDGKDIYEVVVPLTNNAGALPDGVEIDNIIYLNAFTGTDAGNLWAVLGVAGNSGRSVYVKISTNSITVSGSFSVSFAVIQYTLKEES